MYQTRTRRCDDRIVSTSQPHVRPIVRGKPNKSVEFGAKLSVSLTGTGLAHVDYLRWNTFHGGKGLESQVEAYRQRLGHYPESILADPLYDKRDNRKYLKQKGIRFAGKPLGRPKTVTDSNRAELKQQKTQRRENYRQRIPIEGKFGQGKHGYRLSYIRAQARGHISRLDQWHYPGHELDGIAPALYCALDIGGTCFTATRRATQAMLIHGLDLTSGHSAISDDWRG
jgi:IS5 family transposase